VVAVSLPTDLELSAVRHTADPRDKFEAPMEGDLFRRFRASGILDQEARGENGPLRGLSAA
jgi:hypothetical protein